MSSEIKAYADEYNELKSEMDRLHKSLTVSFGDINTKLARLVASGGPFRSQETSMKITALLGLVRQDLHASTKDVSELLDACLCGFASGLDFYDKVAR